MAFVTAGHAADRTSAPAIAKKTCNLSQRPKHKPTAMASTARGNNDRANMGLSPAESKTCKASPNSSDDYLRVPRKGHTDNDLARTETLAAVKHMHNNQVHHEDSFCQTLSETCASVLLDHQNTALTRSFTYAD